MYEKMEKIVGFFGSCWIICMGWHYGIVEKHILLGWGQYAEGKKAIAYGILLIIIGIGIFYYDVLSQKKPKNKP